MNGEPTETNTDPRQQSRWPLFWVILVILLVFFAGLPGIFTYPAENILFSPAAYQQALAEENAYDQFPLLVGQMIAQGGNMLLFGSGTRLLEVLQHSNYDATMRQIFPASWVRAQADGLIDQFWAYFNFQSPRFALVVDFRLVKARLNGSESAQIAANIVQGFPPCQGNELYNFGLGMLQGSVDRLPLCKPPDAFLGAANLLAEGSLKGAAAAMPDQIDLASVLRIPAAVGGSPVSGLWNAGFLIFRAYRRVDFFLPWIALVGLALVGVLGYRTARGPVYWVGVGLLLPGVSAFVIALLLWLGGSQIAPYVVGRLFGANLLVFDLLVGMVGKVLGRFTLMTIAIAVGVSLIGGFLVWWSLHGKQITGREDRFTRQ